MRLEIDVLDTAEGVRVRLRGEAGVPEAADLEAAVSDLLARRPACVTFELSELLSISSLAMDVLVAFCRAAVRAGVRVCLTPDLQSVVRAALNRGELQGLFKAVGGAEACGTSEHGVTEGRTRYPDVDAVQRTFRIAWAELVELEPQLESLLKRARTAGASCRTFTDVDRVFGPVRNELAALIGFAGKHHRHPVLGSVGALEVAYWKLYDAVARLVAGRAAGTHEPADKQRAG
jgi:anti-anti-sigma regulatory factor